MTAVFDPAQFYDALPEDVRRRIGIAAVVFTASSHCLDITGFTTAAEEAVDVIDETFAASFIPAADGFARIDLSAIGVRQCRTCGCTDHHACAGGCSWAEANLCSVCAIASPRSTPA